MEWRIHCWAKPWDRSTMFSFWGSPVPPQDEEPAAKRVYVPHDESDAAPSASAEPVVVHPSPPQQQQAPCSQNESAALAPTTATLAPPSTPAATRDNRRLSRKARDEDALAFEDAHRQTCLRLKTLHASCVQISSTTPDFEVPQRQNVVLWGRGGGPESSNHMEKTGADDADGSAAFAFLAKNAKHFGWTDPEARTFARSWSSSAKSPSASSSSGSALMSSAKSWASRISLGGGGGGGNESSRTPRVDQSDTATYARVKPNEMIVCESLVVDCVRHVLRAVQSSPTTATNPSHAWVLHGSDEYSFRHWLESAAPSPNNNSADGTTQESSPQSYVQAFLMSLKASDLVWLFRLLEYGQVVKVVHRDPGQPAVVVLTAGTSHSAEHCLSVLGLLQTRSRLEQVAEKASNRALELQRHALQQRQSNASKGTVVATMQRSKIYQQQADQNHRALLNVEHSLSLLESSVTTQQVVQAIKQANDVLKAQRVDLEAVDDVLDDMAEHVELDQQLFDAIKSSNNSTLPITALDDDELLQELASLSLVDGGGGAAAASAQQPPSTGPIAAPHNSSSAIQPTPPLPRNEVVSTKPTPALTLPS
jgi:Snf7